MSDRETRPTTDANREATRLAVAAKAALEAGDEDAARDALAGLAAALRWYVLGMGRKLAARSRLMACDEDDLCQTAMAGLRRAVEGFEPGRGAGFLTYATFWFRQDMGCETIRMADAPRPRRHPGECRRTQGRAARDAIFRAAVSREPGPAEAAIDGEFRRGLASAISGLPPVHLRVLTLRFDLDGRGRRKLREVGAEIGKSNERVRQIEDAAILALRGALGVGRAS
jgi:RNA polymerase sigma factor (sigma-70 family)